VLARARRAGPPARARDRDAIGALVAEINSLVLRLEHEAPTPRQHRRRLVLAEELAALELAAAGEEGSGGELPDRR
jgi:hypothetical protein